MLNCAEKKPGIVYPHLASCADQDPETELPRVDKISNVVDMVPEMVTIKEASSRTGLSYDFLRKSCLSGKIVHIRIGNGKFLINFGRLVEWLNTSCGGSAE